jgi:hypothetical protein
MNKAPSPAFRLSTRPLETETFLIKTYFGFTPQRGNNWKHTSELLFRHVLHPKTE